MSDSNGNGETENRYEPESEVGRAERLKGQLRVGLTRAHERGGMAVRRYFDSSDSWHKLDEVGELAPKDIINAVVESGCDSEERAEILTRISLFHLERENIAEATELLGHAAQTLETKAAVERTRVHQS